MAHTSVLPAAAAAAIFVATTIADATAANVVFHNSPAVSRQAFDSTLAGLMRRDEPSIRVDIQPDSVGVIPPHLNGWLGQLLTEDNQVRWRDAGSGQSAVTEEEAGALISRILTELTDVPAADPVVKKYHAVLELESSGSGTTQVRAVEFYRHATTAWGRGLESSHGVAWGNDW